LREGKKGPIDEANALRGAACSSFIDCGGRRGDSRTAINLPPEVRTQFLEHMRTHMTSLDNVIQLLASGKVKEAGASARKEMAIGQGSGLGRYMPQEFRERWASNSIVPRTTSPR
jgi:hypothetical protein